MPNKPTMPRNAKRIPKGYTRKDFEPEVMVEYDRNRWRVSKERHRKRKRHAGRRDVSFLLPQQTREDLALLAKRACCTKSHYITLLIADAALKENLNGRLTNHALDSGSTTR